MQLGEGLAPDAGADRCPFCIGDHRIPGRPSLLVEVAVGTGDTDDELARLVLEVAVLGAQSARLLGGLDRDLGVDPLRLLAGTDLVVDPLGCRVLADTEQGQHVFLSDLVTGGDVAQRRQPLAAPLARRLTLRGVVVRQRVGAKLLSLIHI